MVVPFAGPASDAEAALRNLHGLGLGSEDELLLVDNNPVEAALPQFSGPHRSVAARAQRSPYYARNVGIEAARADWILLLDADCLPPADLLDRLFAAPIGPREGAIAGEVEGLRDQAGLVPAYVRSRRHLDQRAGRAHPFRPMAVTAHLLVRRQAWADVGGFLELTRSGADSDFCWRLQDAGWELGYRPVAVEHSHRDSLRSLAAQIARDGAGATWLRRRWPGSTEPPRLVPRLGRCVVGAVAWPLLGQPRRGIYKAIDAVAVTAEWGGGLLSNAPRGERAPARVVLVAEEFPLPSDDPVAAEASVLDEEGVPFRVEAARRPTTPQRGRRPALAYAEDDGALRRLADLAWLAVSRPSRGPRAARCRLLPLAPVARRVAGSGARELRAPGGGGRLRAARVARLLSLSVSAQGPE